MKNLSVIIILSAYINLYLKVENCKICNKENAINIAVLKFKKKGFQLEHYRCIDAEDSVNYEIQFHLVDTTMEGGGAYFKISKVDCKIIEQRYFQ